MQKPTQQPATGQPDLRKAALPALPGVSYPIDGALPEQQPYFLVNGRLNLEKTIRTLAAEAHLIIARTGQQPDLYMILPTVGIENDRETRLIPKDLYPQIAKRLAEKGLLTTGNFRAVTSADFCEDGKFVSQKAFNWMIRRARSWEVACSEKPVFRDLLPPGTPKAPALIPEEKHLKLKEALLKAGLIRNDPLQNLSAA